MINLDLGGCQGGGRNKVESGVSSRAIRSGFFLRVYGNEGLPNEFPRQPKERFFEVVIRLRRNFKVLDVLLSVESHGTGLDFSLLQSCELC